jgi:hypothetical protein
LIFPKQHPDKLVLPSLEVPRLLLRYTSNPDDHLWPEEVLSLGRYEHQTLEQHFSSIAYNGWRSIVVNKATYKGTCLYNFPEKGCEVSRDCKRTANNFFSSLKITGSPRFEGRTEAISESFKIQPPIEFLLQS